MYKDFNVIVIEGLDCCGKESISKIITRDLKKQNNIVSRMSFPDYHVNDYLVKWLVGTIENTNLNSLDDDTIYEVSRLFMHNIAVSFHEKFQKKLRSLNSTEKTKYLILDRYYHSGMIYQLKKLYDTILYSKNRIDNPSEARDMKAVKYMKFLDEQRKLYNLPSPDYVFFIDSTPEIINFLISHRRHKESDINEDSKSIQEVYDFLNIYGGYTKLEEFCATEGSILTRVANYDSTNTLLGLRSIATSIEYVFLK